MSSEEAIAVSAPPSGFIRDAETQEVIFVGLSGFCSSEKVLKAGGAFAQRLKNQFRGRRLSCDATGDDDGQKAKRQQLKDLEDKILTQYRTSIRRKKFLNLTMYQQLGLTLPDFNYGFDVTPEQVKKAYHRVLIEHHPDKTGKEQNDPNYLAVQKAFQTLTDPKKKKAYDSQCDFDDSIPTGNETTDFYALYRPVFVRNARFSQKTPVPTLGDEQTPLDQVYDFYTFWHHFESWREFTHDAENETDNEADNRDHKRYLQKKIITEAKKKKKAEYGRLANLVDRAMANDPRIKAEKQKVKDEKERKKKEKEDAANKIIQDKKDAEEKIAQELAEKARLEKEASQAKKLDKVKQKKALRKLKKAFRMLMTEAQESNGIDVEDTEFLCDTCDFDTLEQLIVDMGRTPETIKLEGLEKVKAELTKHRGSDYMDKKY